MAEVKARQRCADLGVPSERQQREGRADAGGARPTQFVRRSPSARGLRRPDWHPSRRPCGLGRETAAAPPHISGLRAEAERWPLPHERLKARTLARESREVHRRATPRTATEGRCPPTIPRNSPVSSRFRSGTSARVCVSGERVRERGRERERDGGVRSPDTDSRRGLNWSHLQPPPPQIPTYPPPLRSSTNHINILACTAAKDKSLPPDFSSKGLRQTQKKITGS